MRILHLETGRHLYGGAYQVLLLLKGLNSHGFRNVLCVPADSALAPHARSCADVFPAPMSGELDPRLPWTLWKAIQTYRPHIVHVHSRRGADWWGGLLARMLGIPAVITRRVDNPEGPWVARIKYGFYDRVITISEGISRVLRKEGISEHKIRCVRSCIDPPLFVRPYDRSEFLRGLGISPEGVLIGTVAQFIPRKGHLFLLEAAREVSSAHPEVHFCFFGKGPLRETLETLTVRHNLTSRVHFLGFRDDLDRILPCLDLLVHPATLEGLGVCLLEAAAAGLPIVATSVGGIPEIVRDGLNGLLVEPRNPAKLAEAIIWMLDHPEEAKRMGTRGRDIVKRHFSKEAMVQGNLEVYKEILGEF